MYAAGSSSSSDDVDSTALHGRRKWRSSHGVLKCFILTPTAQYVNPVFADLFPAPHHDDNDDNDPVPLTTTTSATINVDGDASDASSSKPSPNHHPIPLRRQPQQRRYDSIHLSADSSSSSPASTLRSPPSTRSTTLSASPPASLLKHVLMPTPPHSTAAADATTTTTTTGSTTLASSSSSSSPDSGSVRAGSGASGSRTSCLGSPTSMYHSLLHPSPIQADRAPLWMSPLSSSGASHYASKATRFLGSPPLPPSPLSGVATAASSLAPSTPSGAQPLRETTDTHLGILARQFVRLLQSSPHGYLELNHAVSCLGTGKRRIYDVTNVLEGIGLITKVGKNHFEWKPAGADAGNPDPRISSHVEVLRKEIQTLADMEWQIDQYLEFLHRQSRHYLKAIGDGDASIPPANQHMYVRYSDVTDLHTFYGSDTIIGVTAPAGTNLEVPDPERGVEVGKRRYQMFLSSKLPDGSYPLGAKDNRGPIRVYLVRPEAKPGESVSSRPEPAAQDDPAHNPRQQASNPARARGSYVESESVSETKEHNATPVGRKHPYAQSTHRVDQPYASPAYGHPSPYSYFSDVSSSPWSQHPHYNPAYYPPMPAPPAPENDTKPPAKPTKRKRSSLPAPAGQSSSPRRPNADVRDQSLLALGPPVQMWGSPPLYGANAPDLTGHGVSGNPPAFSPTSLGPLSPFWQPSLGLEVATAAASGSPSRHSQEADHGIPDVQDPPIPSSPILSPAAVDPSELFSMPLHSPPGPRRGAGVVYGVGSVDRSIALSPGASAPPGFSPRRPYASSRSSSLPEPVRLSFPSLPSATPPRRPEPPSKGDKRKTKKAKSGRSAVEPGRGDYRRRSHDM